MKKDYYYYYYYYCGAIAGMDGWKGELKFSEETYPSAALSTINPT
jgi:hypothetical protein